MSNTNSGPTGSSSPYGQVPAARGPLSTKAGVRTLVIMLLVLLVVYASAGALLGTGDQSELSTPAEPGGIPVEPEITPVDGPALAELLPEKVSRELQGILQTWFADPERGEIRDRVDVDEEEVVVRLLERDTRLKLESLPKRVYREVKNVPAVLENPAEHRGSLVALWGRVGEARKETLLAGDRTVPAMVFPVDAHNGARFTVTSIGGGVPEAGKWIKTEGVFTKVWPLDDGHDRALHIFTTRPIRSSFPPVAYQERQAEWMAMVEDMKISDAQALEHEPLFGMLNYIKTMGQAGYVELRDTAKIDVTDLRDTRAMEKALLEQPNVHRFQAVRMRGALVPGRFGLLGDVPENAGNIETVYQGYMVVDSNRMVNLISPFSNTDFDIHSSPVVEVEGFFFKRRAVTGENGKMHWMPVVLFTTIKPIYTAEFGVGTAIVLPVVLGGVLLVAIALVVMLYRSRREAEAFRQRQAARRDKRVRAFGDPSA